MSPDAGAPKGAAARACASATDTPKRLSSLNLRNGHGAVLPVTTSVPTDLCSIIGTFP